MASLNLARWVIGTDAMGKWIHVFATATHCKYARASAAWRFMNAWRPTPATSKQEYAQGIKRKASIGPWSRRGRCSNPAAARFRLAVSVGGVAVKSRQPSGAAIGLALFVLPLLATHAQAAGLESLAESLKSTWKRSEPIERIQYFTLDRDEYCWYDDGWNGPGWYWCGNEWITGYGWGGVYGWNGWGGGAYIQRHGFHGIGVWHPGPPHVLGGAPRTPGHRFSQEPSQSGGPQGWRNFGGAPTLGLPGGAGSGFHGYGGEGFHGYGPHAGGAGPSYGFHPGGGPGGFGGFHSGGGGAFFGGHGGGHR
jgi:hypothetical protein